MAKKRPSLGRRALSKLGTLLPGYESDEKDPVIDSLRERLKRRLKKANAGKVEGKDDVKREKKNEAREEEKKAEDIERDIKRMLAALAMDEATKEKLLKHLENSFNGLDDESNPLQLNWGDVVKALPYDHLSLFLVDAVPMGVENQEKGFPKMLMLTRGGILWIEVTPIGSGYANRLRVQLNLPE